MRKVGYLPKSLNRVLKHILALPMPPDSSWAKASTATLRRFNTKYLELWISLFEEAIPAPNAPRHREPTNSTMHLCREDWESAWATLLCYHSSVFTWLIFRNSTLDEGLAAALLRMDAISKNIGQARIPKYRRWAWEFSGLYIHQVAILCALHGLRKNDHVPLGIVYNLEMQYHQMMPRLFRMGLQARAKTPKNASSLVIGYILHATSDIYRHVASTVDMGCLYGPHSMIKPSELDSLAARSLSMRRKYGDKRISFVFEHQLALILQSLGFYVIKTRTGHRTVDLTCVSPDPRARATLLIEAKSTCDKYSLPASDERALRDYIRDTRKRLSTLPPLRAAIIVSSKSGPNMQNKLANISAQEGVPVRFLAASELGRIREFLDAPFDHASFIEYVIAAPPVLPKGVSTVICDVMRQNQEAHATLVNQLFAIPQQQRNPQ